MSRSAYLEPSLFRRFERRLDEALGQLPSPGLNAAVLVDDEIVWSYATGVARYSPDVPLTPSHIHRIGSITKLFTAHLILLLRDDGLLDLDAPVATYIPEFRQPGTEAVTIRHILCHGSGIATNGGLDVWGGGVFPADDEYREILSQMKLVAPPMTYIKYSNAAISMLGLVVQAVTKMPYEACMRERILTPLGLTDTSYYLNPEQEERFAPGHGMPPFERRFEQAPHQDCKSWNACGMLAATTADTLQLARLQWSGNPLLRAETRSEMHRLHSLDDELPGWQVGYGLGWRLSRHGTRIFAGHGGAYVGNRCQMTLSLRDRVAVAVFANSNRATAGPALTAEILVDVIAALPVVTPYHGLPCPEAYRPFVGQYAVRHWHESRIEWGPGGLGLYSSYEPDTVIPLTPAGEGKFLVGSGRSAAEELYMLKRGPNGMATELSLAGQILVRI